MKNKTLEFFFYQILIVFLIYASLIKLGLISSLFNPLLFGVIILITSYFIPLKHLKGKEIKISKQILLIPLLIILSTHLIPYVGNDVPLGYDPGIYKDIFDHNSKSITNGRLNDENWMRSGYPIAISYIIHPLMLIGFSSDFLVSYGLIFFDILIMLALFLVVREYFSEQTAIFAAFIFSISQTKFEPTQTYDQAELDQRYWTVVVANALGLVIAAASLVILFIL
jgi:hypothetical protein